MATFDIPQLRMIDCRPCATSSWFIPAVTSTIGAETRHSRQIRWRKWRVLTTMIICRTNCVSGCLAA